MNWADLNLLPALPELFLLGAVSLILILDLFIKDEQRYLTYGLSLLAVIGCAALQVWTYQPYGQLAFSRMFVADPLSSLVKLSMYLATFLVLVYTRQYIAQRGMFRGEYFTLTLFALLGMNVMASGTHLLTLYVGLEILSLALYALIALQRDSALATEAAMKYFILGALASGLLLYGMSMLYGATGSLYLSEISQSIGFGNGAHGVLIALGIVFIICGLAFKLGAVPFHMWVPDVYQGAPLAVTLMIGAAPKLAAFVFIYRILVQGLSAVSADWSMMLAILAVLSLAIGNITAIAQTNIRRMLAYSTISHMGFLLLGFVATPVGYGAAAFYTVVYTLMSLAGFGVILALSRAGFECESLDDLKGLNSRNSWYALLMLLVMFSMAGIPPLLGFYAKLAIIKALIDQQLVWLAVYAVMMSLIGAFYYLRVVKFMYMDEARDATPLQARPDMLALLSVNVLALLVIGILPDRLLELCMTAIQLSP